MHMPGPVLPGGNGRKQFSPFSAMRGFMARLVSKPVEEVATPQQQRMHRRVRECGVDKRGLGEEDLVKVWEDVLNNFEARVRQRWVQALWRGGVPDSVRGKLWRRAVGNRLGLTTARYEEMLALCLSPQRSSVEGLSCIEQDLPRTGRRQGIVVDSEKLGRVLRAVAALKPEVGYRQVGSRQGMSYIGALVLSVSEDETEAFVILGNLLAQRHFPAFLEMRTCEIEKRWRVFEILLGQECPQLACHLDHIQLSPDLIITDWWFTLFTKDFRRGTSARVMDCVLLEGEPLLMRAAVGLCKALEPALIGKDMEECHTVLGRAGERLSEEAFFSAAASVGASTRYIREMLAGHTESLQDELFTSPARDEAGEASRSASSSQRSDDVEPFSQRTASGERSGGSSRASVSPPTSGGIRPLQRAGSGGSGAGR
ncbi:rab-GTPase-TBC domain-containing protein, partial [Baffinella frigidus]